MKTILKRSTALFISFCMMLSVFGAMLSVNASGSVSEAKKYVSLGDSMTNGYGLPGYDGDMGCYDYGHVSYANQLAAYAAADGQPAQLLHFGGYGSIKGLAVLHGSKNLKNNPQCQGKHFVLLLLW